MSFINHIEGLIAAKFGVVRAFIAIVKLEAKLAALSVFPMLLNLCLLLVVLLTVWLSAMVLLGYFFMTALHSAIMAMMLVLLLNTGLLVILGVYLSSNLKKMSFEKTREYLSNDRRIEHHELKKTSD